MEETVVKATELRRKGVWHYQPYSHEAMDVFALLSKSPYPSRQLGTLLSEDVIRGYSVVSGSADEGIPILSVRNLSIAGVSFDDVGYLTPIENEKLVRTQVQNGDVIVALVVRPGLAALYEHDNPANLDSHLARLRITDNIDARYLVYYLNSDIGQALIRSLVTGNIQPVLTLEALMQLPVILPSLTEQKEVALAAEKLTQEAAKLTENAKQRREEAFHVFNEFLGGDVK
jgi:restriction endonuclease S subunit